MKKTYLLLIFLLLTNPASLLAVETTSDPQHTHPNAVSFCESLGKRLSTSREMAQFAIDHGAAGITARLFLDRHPALPRDRTRPPRSRPGRTRRPLHHSRLHRQPQLRPPRRAMLRLLPAPTAARSRFRRPLPR